MTTATLPAPTFTPARLRWTCDTFHDVCDTGVFEGRNVILVDGEILEMPAPNPPHDMALTLADYQLKKLFATGFVVRVQMGLVFGLRTDPVPDIAVVTGSPRDYTTHPRTAVLVVEVADSSLSYDRTDKASLYASAGVADYWVVDVAGRKVEVFRDPRPDGAQPFGAKYASATAFGPGDDITPLAGPGGSVPVAELLP